MEQYPDYRADTYNQEEIEAQQRELELPTPANNYRKALENAKRSKYAPKFYSSIDTSNITGNPEYSK